jgi:hypothetical protein
MENQREHDLVRQMRMELHRDGLITEAEYSALASEHGGVQRLEDYDVLRAQMEAQDRDATALRAERKLLLEVAEAVRIARNNEIGPEERTGFKRSHALVRGDAWEMLLALFERWNNGR